MRDVQRGLQERRERNEQDRQRNETRRAVKDLFPSRHCFTMVPVPWTILIPVGKSFVFSYGPCGGVHVQVLPVADEKKLNRLADVPDEEIRPEFLRDVCFPFFVFMK